MRRKDEKIGQGECHERPVQSIISKFYIISMFLMRNGSIIIALSDIAIATRRYSLVGMLANAITSLLLGRFDSLLLWT